MGSITVGSQYLVWNFETDSTLADAIEGRLGAFPECISDLFLSNADRLDEDERDYRVHTNIDMSRIDPQPKNRQCNGY